MFDYILLFAAGIVAGVMNAVAGGGTFVAFPALVFTGVPMVTANATATVAALPGYLAATMGFRRDIASIKDAPILKLTIWTLIGGATGSGLLLISSDGAFEILVPFLMLLATIVFYWSEQTRRIASRWRSVVTPFGLGVLLPVTIYGGYFNGGLGIIFLATFAMWGMKDLNQMNGLKSWLSFVLAMIAFVIFALAGKVAWGPAAVMALGTITGGYTGAPISRLIPKHVLRTMIAAVGFGMTGYFFWELFRAG